jgi:hypothetical protein
MNVNRSLELAFLGRSTFEPTYATVPTKATPRREYREVVVNIAGGAGVGDIVMEVEQFEAAEKVWDDQGLALYTTERDRRDHMQSNISTITLFKYQEFSVFRYLFSPTNIFDGSLPQTIFCVHFYSKRKGFNILIYLPILNMTWVP